MDLVVHVDVEELEILRAVLGQPEEAETQHQVGVSDGRGELSSGSFKIGQLNLIVVTNQRDFDTWMEGAKFLKASAPVTRDEAIAHFRLLRKRNEPKEADPFSDL